MQALGPAHNSELTLIASSNIEVTRSQRVCSEKGGVGYWSNMESSLVKNTFPLVSHISVRVCIATRDEFHDLFQPHSHYTLISYE